MNFEDWPTRWLCDGCEQWITSPSEGILIWEVEAERPRRFRIIHTEHEMNGRIIDCKRKLAGFHHVVGSFHLREYRGPVGIANLLQLLARQERGGLKDVSQQVESLGEFMDIFRRLYVPFYEELRMHLHEDLAKCDNPDVLMDPRTLQGIYERRYGYEGESSELEEDHPTNS